MPTLPPVIVPIFPSPSMFLFFSLFFFSSLRCIPKHFSLAFSFGSALYFIQRTPHFICLPPFWFSLPSLVLISRFLHLLSPPNIVTTIEARIDFVNVQLDLRISIDIRRQSFDRCLFYFWCGICCSCYLAFIYKSRDCMSCWTTTVLRPLIAHFESGTRPSPGQTQQ